MITKKQTFVLDLDVDRIFDINETIRFVGVCTAQGNLLHAKYKKDIMPLLNHTELQFHVIKTAIRHTTRINNNELGKPVYSITAYENVKRATIPLDNDLLLLISFESSTNAGELIPKILNVVFGR